MPTLGLEDVERLNRFIRTTKELTMGLRQVTEDFEQAHRDWFTAGGAGFDLGKGLAHRGQGNAWVRATDKGWNAVNLWWDSVDPNCPCTASAWLRLSPSLTDGYISVRSGLSDGEPGPVISEIKLVGPGPINPDNGGYSQYQVEFDSGANRRVLFYVGLWGNGQDSWIQIDDVVLSCITPD